MFRKKIKNIFLIFVLSLILFWVSSQAKIEEGQIFNFSLNFQKLIKDFWGKIFPSTEEDFYKEKYYELLKELANLKLSLKQIKEAEIITQREKYLPYIVPANILKVDSLGYVYAENPGAREGIIVLDRNWVLVGKVTKIAKNYLVITSLSVPGIEFNVSNVKGELLGLAKTISNGFLEINYVKPEMEVKLNDLILTYGDDNFPSDFLVGTVRKINKTQFGQQIIVKLLFDLDPGKIYLVK